MKSFRHFTEESDYIDSLSFPAYATNPFFVEDIKTEIDLLCKQKFGSNFVIYDYPDGIELQYGIFPKKKNEKDFIIRKNSISISIHTSILLGIETIEESVYNFKASLTAYDSENQKVYSFSHKIPFVAMESEVISGKTIMSAEDFYNFYFDAIRAVFEGKKRKTEKRYIYKPQTLDYPQFLDKTHKFYIKKPFNTYQIGKSLTDQKKILAFESDLWRNISGYDRYSRREIWDFLTKTGFTLLNIYSDEIFSVRLKEIRHDSYQEINSFTNIDLEIYKDKELIGEFRYNNKDELEGTFLEEEHKFQWSAINKVSEYYYKDKLIVLVKELPDFKIIYVTENINKKEVANFYTLLFLYDFSLMVKEISS